MLVKRIFDFVIAVIGLFFLFPLFALISCLVKLDSAGPVFFRQERVGLNGKNFRIFKFRTMISNSEVDGLLTIGRDKRITTLGRYLRAYKLDELPQLINVLIGDMSLVGPRPEVPHYIDYYPEDIRQMVLSVRPGITDWASIEYKDENALLGKSQNPEQTYIQNILPVKLDYYVNYIKKRSLLLDIKIILNTIIAVFK